MFRLQKCNIAIPIWPEKKMFVGQSIMKDCDTSTRKTASDLAYTTSVLPSGIVKTLVGERHNPLSHRGFGGCSMTNPNVLAKLNRRRLGKECQITCAKVHPTGSICGPLCSNVTWVSFLIEMLRWLFQSLQEVRFAAFSEL